MASAKSKHRPQLVKPFWADRGGPGNRSFVDRPSPQGLREQWRIAFGDQTTAPVVGGDGTIFVGGFDKHLYAFSPQGDKVFKDKLVGPVMTDLAIGVGGIVFVAPHHRPPTGLETMLTAVDPSAPKDRVRWQAALGGVCRALLADADGGVVALSSRGVLHAYDEAGGERFAVTVAEPEWESGATCLSDGTVVTFGCAGGQWWVTGVTTTGEVRFRTAVPKVLARPTAMPDGGFWVVTMDGGLVRFDADGAETSRTPSVGASLQSSSISALPDGELRLALARRGEGRLLAFGAGGETRWAVEHPDGLSASPLAFSDGATLSSVLDGTLVSVDADGRSVWSLAVGPAADETGYTQGSPVVPRPEGGVVLRVDAPMSPTSDRQKCELVALG